MLNNILTLKSGLEAKVRGYQFFESVSYPYPKQTIRIRIFYK